jgi:hypothetical protein
MLNIINLNYGIALDEFRLEGGRFVGKIRCEPLTRADWTTHDYNVHFCFGLHNDGPAAEEVLISIPGGDLNTSLDWKPLLFFSNSPEGPWKKFDGLARTDLKNKYNIHLLIESGQTIFLANTLPRSFDYLSRRFNELARHGAASRFVYGKSRDGKELVAYKFGATSNNTILVTSGFHPPEPDTLATDAIMEWLGTPDGSNLCAKLSIVVIPIVNPDGYSRQTQGSNKAGINMFWDFRVADPELCPEAIALWNFVATFKPVAYIDYHAYTFQLGKAPGPYLKPIDYYVKSIREVVSLIYKNLLSVEGTHAVSGFSTYAPSTLGQRLTVCYGTISIAKYHLHLKEGVDGCRSRGLEAFQIISKNVLLLPKKACPNGREIFWQKMRILWAGFFRPTLGLLRRGRFSELNFRRSDHIFPTK